MSSTEKIPRATAEKFAAITALTDAFCEKHLNDEYRVLIHRLVGGLARKRPPPKKCLIPFIPAKRGDAEA